MLLLLDLPVRRLIVNADDFGLTPGVNRGIAEAHAQGIVTSTTLMANASAFEDAIQLAAASPRLSVGCHLVLVDGSPVLDAGQIPTLTNGKRKGEFEENVISFAIRAWRRRINADQIEAEATAQIRKLQNAGIRVSHIDTHKHVHIFPQVLHPLLRAAQACGVRAIRNPFGRIAFSHIAARPRLWKRYGQIGMLNSLAAKFRRTVAKAGMTTTDGSLGVVVTGALDGRLLRLILEDLPEGTWELVCHPGYNDAALQSVRTRLRGSREVELGLLTSAETRESLARGGVQLASYCDLWPG